ncbi:hypothetical protein R50073_12180 [Maricurvus nonylphenolicus]|uniref:LysR family transcriptional regulator n=1 Tax=Maricurvus nonylphenolicus TaxID=1008307 RepID=UPI0036F39885
MILHNHMAIFAEVVSKGSFTQAAESLGMPKSTVSLKVTQLEDEIETGQLIKLPACFTLQPRNLSLVHPSRELQSVNLRRFIDVVLEVYQDDRLVLFDDLIFDGFKACQAFG